MKIQILTELNQVRFFLNEKGKEMNEWANIMRNPVEMNGLILYKKV